MEIREPQLAGYKFINKNLSKYLDEVLKAIERLQPCSYKDISQYLNKNTSTITGRISNLESVGLIKVVGIAKGQGKTHLYKICTHREAKEKQAELLEHYTEQREDLINGLDEVKNEAIRKITTKKISYYTEKIKHLKRFKV